MEQSVLPTNPSVIFNSLVVTYLFVTYTHWNYFIKLDVSNLSQILFLIEMALDESLLPILSITKIDGFDKMSPR